MPESTQFPGCYWATPRSEDAATLLERCKLPAGDPNYLVCSVGHITTDTVVIFTPLGIAPDRRGREMQEELREKLGGLWLPGTLAQ